MAERNKQGWSKPLHRRIAATEFKAMAERNKQGWLRPLHRRYAAERAAQQ
jgi:hypothetical protein